MTKVQKGINIENDPSARCFATLQPDNARIFLAYSLVLDGNNIAEF
jgi:hypothetical protein